MFEEFSVPGTKIIDYRSPACSGDKAMLWTASPAGAEYRTGHARFRQRIELVATEGNLQWRIDQFCQRHYTGIAKQMIDIDKMVTGIDVTIVLNGQRTSTNRLMMAD